METKTILAKKGLKALFLYQWHSKFEFVIATMDKQDLSKRVGEKVNGWYGGRYFNELTSAVKYLEENY